MTFFERTADTAANRCIKYATWMLAKRYMQLSPKAQGQRKLHRKLNALMAVFSGVTLDHRRGFMDDAQVLGARPLPTLRPYYREALDVAVAIVEQRAVLIDSPSGPLRMPALVLNMNHVFEAYIRNILRIHAQSNDWPVEILNGNDEGRKDLFNEKPSELARPDIVVSAPDGTTPLVLEIKNVPVKALFSERDAIHQTVTYALTYRTKQAVLVHPRKSPHQDSGMRLLGVIDDVAVHQYRFDLGAERLEEQDRLFGDAVGQLLAQLEAA